MCSLHLTVTFPCMGAGILEVLYCVLEESPEALNFIKETHIKTIISLLDKNGRNHKVEIQLCLLLISTIFIDVSGL